MPKYRVHRVSQRRVRGRMGVLYRVLRLNEQGNYAEAGVGFCPGQSPSIEDCLTHFLDQENYT